MAFTGGLSFPFPFVRTLDFITNPKFNLTLLLLSRKFIQMVLLIYFYIFLVFFNVIRLCLFFAIDQISESYTKILKVRTWNTKIL